MERNLDSLITELERITYVNTAISSSYVDGAETPNSEVTRMVFDSLSDHIIRIVEDLDKLNVPKK